MNVIIYRRPKFLVGITFLCNPSIFQLTQNDHRSYGLDEETGFSRLPPENWKFVSTLITGWLMKFTTKLSNSITRQIWGIWKLRPAYSPETLNLGQNRWCFVPSDLEIWWMTLENNRASLLCCFKLCATFRSHRWFQTWVTVRKRPIWVKFDDF